MLVLISMDNFQLACTASLHSHTQAFHGGVFSPDTLPAKITKYPIFFFCNSDMSYETGTHWLLICLRDPDHHPFYFDSLGKKPEEHNVLIRDFLSLHGPEYQSCEYRVQNYNTRTCGFYCLYVADLFCCGYSTEEILEKFEPTNLAYNEMIVQEYVNGHMLIINNQPFKSSQ